MSKQPQQKSRLGRGLSSLIGMNPLPPEPVAPVPGSDSATATVASPTPSAPEAPGIRVLEIPLGKLSANPHQPRRTFNEGSLQALAESLKTTGIIQPVVARATDTGAFELIAGERRWRAAGLAGLETLPVIVRTVDPVLQAEMALIENIQREDLNAIDRAAAYKALLDNLGLTHNELADRLGEDRSVIGHHLRLLDLTPAVQQMVAEGRLSASHGRLLAGVADATEQLRLAELVISQGLSTKNLERLLAPGTQPSAPVPSPQLQMSAHLADLEKQLSRQLGMRVQVRPGRQKGKGRLVIHFANLDQFDDITGRLGVKTDDN